MSFSIYELFGLAVILYTFLPTLLSHFMYELHWRGQRTSSIVALTFDDGPDPTYTPQVLEILKQYNARASFFLVGRHAEQYPDLVERILTEGHTLGTHGYGHRFSWFQGPLATIREIRQGNQAIARITGKGPLFFRPSWGVCNPFSLIYLWFKNQKILLWSFMSWDWSPVSSPSKITETVLKKIKPGAVVLFHDRCTKPGAGENCPAKMLEALPQVLKALQHRGLHAVGLEELVYKEANMLKRFLLKLWQVWEWCFEKVAGLQPAGDLFRLTVRSYRGAVMELPDGTLLNPGDKVGELHLNNDLLQTISSTTRSIERIGVSVLRETRRSLPLLARAVAQDPAYRSIKALVGITMIHRGTKRLGFSVYDLPPGIRPLIAWYQRWLLFLFHPGGLTHLRKHWNKLVPKKVIISKQELVKRYLLDGVGPLAETPVQPVEVLSPGNWNRAS